MSRSLPDLEPALLWAHFDNIRQVPRPSKHEEQVRQLVSRWAKENAFSVRSDGYGNLAIEVPASQGLEGAPVIVLQAHLDMVCEKAPGKRFDFLAEPIQVEVVGEWVTANSTTLGADNGIGLAAAMAVAEDSAVDHGPLQLLFTVEEELGLRGAQELDSSLLHGHILLNLDSEDSAFYIGCAGACETLGRFRINRAAGLGSGLVSRIKVTGLRGGHSGLSILERRANALKLLAIVLRSARERNIPFALVDLAGGGSRNAIPREASAVILLDPMYQSMMRQTVKEIEYTFRCQFDEQEGDLRIEWEDTVGGNLAIAPAEADNLLDAIGAWPHGVQAMDREIQGLVETSNNLATIVTTNDEVILTNLTRSSSSQGLDAVYQQIAAVLRLAGAEAESRGGYPGWQPRLDSRLLRTASAVYEREFGRQPRVKAIHGGLECGVIGSKIPGMEAISFGPTIEGAHTPDERVHVGTVNDFYRLLKALIAEIAHTASTR